MTYDPIQKLERIARTVAAQKRYILSVKDQGRRAAAEHNLIVLEETEVNARNSLAATAATNAR